MKLEKDKEINISEVTLARSNRTEYPVTAVVDLPNSTKVVFREKQTRQRGTGYKNELYQIVGTGDALIVYRNWYDQEGFYDSAEILEGYFTSKKDYGQQCRRKAKELNCSMELALAFGPETIGDFLSLVSDIKDAGRTLTRNEVHALANCGIERRKDAIYSVLGEGPVANVVSWMGQLSSMRVAKYLMAAIPEAPKSEPKPRHQSAVGKKYCDSASVGTSLAQLLENIQV